MKIKLDFLNKNDPEKMMRSIAEKLSDKHIKALAEYTAGLR